MSDFIILAVLPGVGTFFGMEAIHEVREGFPLESIVLVSVISVTSWVIVVYTLVNA